MPIAVLYQEIPPPILGGNKKLAKPGGYQDNGTDIA
jgi:hypothetical protein